MVINYKKIPGLNVKYFTLVVVTIVLLKGITQGQAK